MFGPFVGLLVILLPRQEGHLQGPAFVANVLWPWVKKMALGSTGN